jgi:site-specific DNA-cytosine methylase
MGALCGIATDAPCEAAQPSASSGSDEQKKDFPIRRLSGLTLLTFDGAAWRGRVDCIAAGFPCQDISIAGRRAGLDGKRSGLFFDILDLADACGAWLLSLENVSAIATATASVVDEAEGALDERAAARVVGELADRGWHAEWITLSASDVGASHGRERWFCLAWRVADTATRPAHVLGRRRLNPAFGCWLMGWPSWWTNPGITSSVKSEMASYRCRLQSHLSSLLGEQESST